MNNTVNAISVLVTMLLVTPVLAADSQWPDGYVPPEGYDTSITKEVPKPKEPTAQEIAIHRYKIKLAELKQACYDGAEYTYSGDKVHSAVDCNPVLWKAIEEDIDKVEQK